MYIFWSKCVHISKLLKLLYKKDIVLVSFLHPPQLIFWINKIFTISRNFQDGVKWLITLKVHVKLIPSNQVWNQFRGKSLFLQATFTFPLKFALPLFLQCKNIRSEEKWNNFKNHDGRCGIEFYLELIIISQAIVSIDMSTCFMFA